MATEVIYRETRRRYHWPEVQLNLWVFVMLAGASTVLGIFAWFMTVQTQMRIGIPWYVSATLPHPLYAHANSPSRLFPFGITTGGLTLIFLLVIMILGARRMLIPGGILIGSFILFVLWLTCLIETAIQLYGPQGNVNSNCNNYVNNQQYTGVSVETLAWLTQDNICSCWKAAFAWEIIATVLFFWMMILAWQVQNDDSDD